MARGDHQILIGRELRAGLSVQIRFRARSLSRGRCLARELIGFGPTDVVEDGANGWLVTLELGDFPGAAVDAISRSAGLYEPDAVSVQLGEERVSLEALVAAHGSARTADPDRP